MKPSASITAAPVFRSKWERQLGATESFIESTFLERFCEAAIVNGYRVGKTAKSPNETICVLPQKWIDQRRVDFLISFHFFGCDIQVVVECDGHQFHDITKEQAKRDRRRDRELQRAGFRIFRYTGSELHADADGCVTEVMDVIMTFQTSVFEAAIQKAAAA